MARLEQHHQHFAPQILGLHGFEERNLAGLRHGLVFLIAFLEGLAVEIMQIRHIARAEERPFGTLLHAFHEQIRNPVRSVHVRRAAALITGVAAQLKEVLNVKVPCFKVRAHGALALAALVHGHGGVVGHFQEWNHALTFAVGAVDVRAGGANVRPVVAQAAGPFGKARIVCNQFEDALEVIIHRAQVAGGKLRMQRARVEQRGRGRHEPE